MNRIHSEKLHEWGLAVLRIVVGIVFLAHGGQKLFVWGFGGVAGAFAKMGIPLPTVSAVVVSLAEFAGGAALVFGLLTRWAAGLLSIVMLVATIGVHWKGGFFAPQGIEYPLTLLAATVALALAGSGAAALDRCFAR